MKVMATSFKRSHSRPPPTHTSARDSWTPTASLAQSLVGSLLLSPGSSCAQGFVCALQEFASPVLWKFCNQIPVAFKFPGGSQSLCRIHRLGNLLRSLELWQQRKNIFGIIVLQVVGRLPSGSVVGLMATSSKRTDVLSYTTHICCSQSPCPCGRLAGLCFHRTHSNTQRQDWLSLVWLTRFCLSPLSISGGCAV